MDSIRYIVRGCIDTFYLEPLYIKDLLFETPLVDYISTEFNTLNNSVFQTSTLNLLTSVFTLDTSFYKYVIIFLPCMLICQTLQMILLLLNHLIEF